MGEERQEKIEKFFVWSRVESGGKLLLDCSQEKRIQGLMSENIFEIYSIILQGEEIFISPGRGLVTVSKNDESVKSIKQVLIIS